MPDQLQSPTLDSQGKELEIWQLAEVTPGRSLKGCDKRQKLNDTPMSILRGNPTLVDCRKNGEVIAPFQPV
jgi:hypothetical protein